MFEAAIFDMDGVLIDSEPLWQEAEIRVFESVGVRLTPEMCRQTTGLRVDEVVRYRYEQHPWRGKSPSQVEAEILEELQRLIEQKGEPMPGVAYILSFFEKRGVRLALASSSYMRVIDAVLRKLGLAGRFAVVHSGESEERGKPDPGIYRSTLQQLNLPPDRALAFEDSYNGLMAARSAGLKTVAILDSHACSDARYDIADLKLRSLLDFNEAHLQRLEHP